MLDLHNHVLFGLDDGCRTLEESVLLARKARAAGHAGFVATPHIRPGMFDNTPEGIRARRAETEAAVRAEGLELFLGAEYYFDFELLGAARAKRLLTLGERSRFVLVELPSMMLPPRWDEVLFEIRLAGYVPVIAHPERCRGVAGDVDRSLEALRQAGVLLQLDLGSLVGHYGGSAAKAAEALIARGAYHVVACDLHRPQDVEAIVAPGLKVLEKLLAKRKKREELGRLTLENPRQIVGDGPLEAIQSV